MEVLAVVDLKQWALVGCLILAALSLVASLFIAWTVLKIEEKQTETLKIALGKIAGTLDDKETGLIDDVVAVLKALPLKMRYAGLLVIAALLFALGGLLGAGLVDISLGTTTTTTTTGGSP